MFAALLFLSLVCDSAASRDVHLCSCVIASGRPNVNVLVQEALRRADAVFVGSVASVTDRAIPLPSRPSLVMRDRKIVLVLERRWKGAARDSAFAVTRTRYSDYGHPIQLKEHYHGVADAYA